MNWGVSSARGQGAPNAWTSTPPSVWIQQARETGDPVRGALLFYQPTLACARCHLAASEGTRAIGPELGHARKLETHERLTDDQLIESILDPSKTIRNEYSATQIRTREGEVLTGAVLQRSESEWRLCDANGATITVATSEIESSVETKESLMPAGLVNLLPGPSALADLLRYLMEIRDAGPERAQALRPDPSLLVVQVPAYESDIDHAGMIRAWNRNSLERGQAIYSRVCANCHGTQDQPGSLPTAPRFGEAKLKNGNDPHALYRTLTYGLGFMPAQSWMVPAQKYDVIHYVRETFLQSNPQHALAPIDDVYLAGLPPGSSLGPPPSQIEAWNSMDYGNDLTHCFEIPGERHNIAYKGIAIRLDPGPGGVARGKRWMVFDTDTLRWAAGWTATDGDAKKRFIDWRDIQFNGEHGIHPRIVGSTLFANAAGPGWADPATGDFSDDQRVEGRDGRRYGPLPRSWGQYLGLVRGGSTIDGPNAGGPNVAVSYRVGDAEILERPNAWETSDGEVTMVRTLRFSAHRLPLALRIADLPDDSQQVPLPYLASPIEPSVLTQSSTPVALYLPGMTVGISGAGAGMEWSVQDGRLVLRIPASEHPYRLAVWMRSRPDEPSSADKFSAEGLRNEAAMETQLESLLHQPMPDEVEFPTRWPQTLEVPSRTTFTGQGFAVEEFVTPEANPWLAQLRLTGLDFFSDGSLAVCTWDGDVWRVREFPERGFATWKRMASGLYQPLGLKVLDDTVYLTCRDQLAVLRDRNGDDEADWIECLNNDHQVTEHFHEFAMGLQVDAAGDFYYAKSGRHALPAVIPQHGTLLRVAADGSRTEILATGFRAANGVCLNPDGSFLVTDQEGFWNPKNRINWVERGDDGSPRFYGNMFGYHDVTDTSDAAMEPPLCWITNAFDRSPAELLWIDSPAWGELKGGLLNFSYGYGKAYLVLHERVGNLHQGGMIELPIPSFPTGIMRGRFHPQDHQLYVCGMYSWAGSATAPGGLYRITKLDGPSHLPVHLSARTDGLHLAFHHPLQPESVRPGRISVKAWDLKRSERYGSDHFNERLLPTQAAEWDPESQTVRISVEGLEPTWGMEIRYDFVARDGQSVRGTIHNTIHRLADAP